MENVLGILSSRRQAEEALRRLEAIGVPADAIIYLTPEVPESPESSESKIESVPIEDTEPPGLGKTLGSYVGGVIGASTGLAAGSALASLAVPGVGTIMAAGLGAAAALGIGGAFAGAAIGGAAEKASVEGVPHDDALFYRDLLKRGRSLVLISTDSDELAANARDVLHQCGAEDIEQARKEFATGGSQQAA